MRGVLSHDRQDTVIGRPRLCDKTIRNFVLQHQNHSGKTIALSKEPKEERSRNVIGEIGDDNGPDRQVFDRTGQGIAEYEG